MALVFAVVVSRLRRCVGWTRVLRRSSGDPCIFVFGLALAFVCCCCLLRFIVRVLTQQDVQHTHHIFNLAGHTSWLVHLPVDSSAPEAPADDRGNAHPARSNSPRLRLVKRLVNHLNNCRLSFRRYDVELNRRTFGDWAFIRCCSSNASGVGSLSV